MPPGTHQGHSAAPADALLQLCRAAKLSKGGGAETEEVVSGGKERHSEGEEAEVGARRVRAGDSVRRGREKTIGALAGFGRSVLFGGTGMSGGGGLRR